MITFLLIMLFVGFISLGLPDALGGVAWPLMYADLNVPLAFANLIFLPSMVGAIISSLFIGKINKILSPGWVIAISCILTSVGVIGVSFSTNVWMVLLFAFPMGLGAGGVDATINSFVAKYFTARHMNWLHASYGIGTTIGPMIMLFVIQSTGTWRWGNRTVGIVQFGIGLFFIATLGIWKKAKPVLEKKLEERQQTASPDQIIEEHKEVSKREVFRLVLAFAIYAGLESTIMTWATTYFNLGVGAELVLSGQTATVYYACFVVGRALSGFIVNKLGLKRMVILGTAISIAGLACILVASYSMIFGVVGMGLIGLGYAPIYPCMMQQTPLLVGKDKTSAVIGYQMAASNLCYFALPLLIGFLGEHISLYLVPISLLVLAVLFVLVKIVFENKCRKMSNTSAQ